MKGVGVKNDGQYVAFVANGEVYMAPVKTVAQLRPFFKYIDSAAQERRQEEYKQNANPQSQRAQVVTMSVKSVSDQANNRLTGSLLAHKIADEEDATELEWIESTFEQYKEGIMTESKEAILKPLDKDEDYLSKLL